MGKIYYIFSYIILISLLFLGCKDKNSKIEITHQISKDTLIPKKEPDTIKIIGQIIPNKGLWDALLAMRVSREDVLKIINVLRFNVDFYKNPVRITDSLYGFFSRDTTKLYKIVYKPNLITYHIVERITLPSGKDSFVYKGYTLPFKKRFKILTGGLTDSIRTLDEALRRTGLKNSLVQEINDALSAMISFRFDARVGDSFKVLVEDYIYKDTIFGGKVYYAMYKGKRVGKKEAFWYEDGPNSSYNSFYTESGVALINSKLRYPLDHIFVVSRFGWRIHPVLGIRKFHNGVDFRARVGTPVYAAATGIVERTGYDRYSGKKIIIRHPDGTRTYYLHLSRILVRKGQRVRSRQLIALSGATGRVTGPHLHFGIKEPNGRWADPLKKRMIAVTRLKGKRLKKFKRQVEVIKSILDSLENKNNDGGDNFNNTTAFINS